MPVKRTKKLKKDYPIDVSENKIVELPKSQDQSFSSLLLSKPALLVVAVVALVLLYQFKGLFIATIVNGQPISRLSVIEELEKQGGKKTLDALITKTLILQEAKKKNVTVSQKEIDDQLKKIKDSLSKQGQNFDQLLASQGLSKQDVIDQIMFEKLIEKMAGKDIKVTDKEVDLYIEQNKDSLGETASSSATRDKIREQLKQQKLSEKVQSWLENLRTNAKINRFVSY